MHSNEIDVQYFDGTLELLRQVFKAKHSCQASIVGHGVDKRSILPSSFVWSSNPDKSMLPFYLPSQGAVSREMEAYPPAKVHMEAPKPLGWYSENGRNQEGPFPGSILHASGIARGASEDRNQCGVRFTIKSTSRFFTMLGRSNGCSSGPVTLPTVT